jgi:flagellar basal-body rod protein FlgF
MDSAGHRLGRMRKPPGVYTLRARGRDRHQQSPPAKQGLLFALPRNDVQEDDLDTLISPLEAIAAGMSSDSMRLAAAGQNLVNANTPAYKRDVVRAHAFPAMFESGIGHRVPARAALRPATDHSAGTLRQTGRALDVGIEGAGAYFEVQTEEGPAYTRRGDFTVDAEGRLCDHAGHPVLGQGGPLGPVGDAPAIDADGTLRSGGRVLGQIRLVSFEREDLLDRGAGSLYAAGRAVPQAEPGRARLRQQHLEVSNVDSAAEMVTLMETMRHFEASQKVVQGMDDMMERALRKLGEF